MLVPLPLIWQSLFFSIDQFAFGASPTNLVLALPGD